MIKNKTIVKTNCEIILLFKKLILNYHFKNFLMMMEILLIQSQSSNNFNQIALTLIIFRFRFFNIKMIYMIL